MSKEFLSQDEVDALLRGETGEAEEKKAEQDPHGIRPYNIAKQERIVRGRMPTLEIINERFARLLRIGLFNLMRRTCNISVGPVKVVKYSEFIRNLVVPTNLNLVQMKPLRGTALFIFDPNLVFLVVDNLFGGDGRFHLRVEGREFTQTEMRIIHHLLDTVFEGYEKSWQSVCSVKFEYLRSEMNTQFANIATPSEVVVTTTFSIEIATDVSADMHICMPYSMLEPIRDALCSSLQGEQMESDKRWVARLAQQVQAAEIQLVVNLAQIESTFGRLLQMKVGDVLTLELPQTVTAEVDGIPVMECRYGVSNGKYALRVERLLSHAPAENNPASTAVATV
ncbi:MAG TPA: flagellar motor switch protein FliM [Burkholderiales bacterium]|nr:flagellar motor switch protein FliM [Burkholderiales bacterium]